MPYTGSFELGSWSRRRIGAYRFARRLVPLIYVVSGLAFLSDLQRDNTLAYGIIYTPLIGTAVFHRRRKGLWLLTGSACIMVVIGAFIPVIGGDLPDLIGNRVLSIIAILATAAFVYHARDIQDRLADQTRRAAAAERIKSDVLNDLSQEIRTPLHALLGVLTLTMANSRPDQKATLGRIRNDGKQLLATIDNLIDLSQVEDRTLQLQPLNLTTIARDAAQAAGTMARERQITVAFVEPDDGGPTTAIGDSWAIRRILDNFLANAVRQTPPGGAVSVQVGQNNDTARAWISDTGNGLPPEVTQEFHEDAPTSDGTTLRATGGAGLALSSRLARTMNGRVIARNQPDSGAIVSLSLPLASSEARRL